MRRPSVTIRRGGWRAARRCPGRPGHGPARIGPRAGRGPGAAGRAPGRRAGPREPAHTARARGPGAGSRHRRASDPRVRRVRPRALRRADRRAAPLAIATDAPFVERLVHFWSNHFAVSADKQPSAALAGLYEHEAIRPHVDRQLPRPAARRRAPSGDDALSRQRRRWARARRPRRRAAQPRPRARAQREPRARDPGAAHARRRRRLHPSRRRRNSPRC